MSDPYPITTEKPAGDVENYQIDWAGNLARGEVIEGLTVAVPTGLTYVANSASYTTSRTTATVSGGTPGTSYDIGFTITTNLCPSPGKTRFIRVTIEA